jgi:hypothetical protein
MSWFQLGPDEIAQRVGDAESARGVPALSESIARGVIGFTIISVAGFSPWVFAGMRLYRSIGEAGLYAVCAVVFIALSGPLLHRLIMGAGSLRRFYQLFSVAFAAYAGAWTVSWMALGGSRGSIVGLLAGTVLMGGIFAIAFEAGPAAWKLIGVLFICNTIGYFSGGWALDALSTTARTSPAFDKLAWGICYGIGFGAGLGVALHLCQNAARARLRPAVQATP